MLKLNTVLNIEEQDFNKYKIHFAIGSKSNNKLEPLYAFQNNTFKEWQESQTRKNFEREYIISLIYYKEGKWLFAGVYKTNGFTEDDGEYRYKTTLVKIQKDLIGRIVIDYSKEFRYCYVFGENYIKEFYVSEISEKPVMIEDFPGYNKVNIDFDKLKLIIEKEVVTWRNALAIMKGVYIIIDRITGEQYVGSATGDKAFWSRWSDYIKNGHGGNTKLKKVICENGFEYARNFKFSILETTGISTADETILQREAFWKDILMTREFGYNEN